MPAMLTVDNIADKREVTDYSLNVYQNTDEEGRPSSKTFGGQISLTIKSLEDGNTDIMDWAVDPNSARKCSIEFLNRTGTAMKKVELEEAYCVSWEEDYDYNTGQSQRENIVISAKVLKIGEAKIENTWAE